MSFILDTLGGVAGETVGIIRQRGVRSGSTLEESAGFDMKAVKDEVIYMSGLGLVLVDKSIAEAIKNIAKANDERGFMIIGIDSSPRFVDFPARHGTAENCAEWDDLPAELKNKVHETIFANLTTGPAAFDTASALAWASTNREIHGEFTDMLYSKIKLHFTVTDMDFAEPIDFITSISTAACHALLKNNSLHIAMRFTTDHLCEWMLRGTSEWLGVCTETIKKLQRKPFNGIRIPWTYHADGEDFIAHIEWETKVARWPKRFAEWENELRMIKECFQQAPLLL